MLTNQPGQESGRQRGTAPVRGQQPAPDQADPTPGLPARDPHQGTRQGVTLLMEPDGVSRMVLDEASELSGEQWKWLLERAARRR